MVTARTSVTVVAVDVRGPGSKIDSSPNMSDGPKMPSRFSRPSGDLRPIFTLPDMDDVQPVAWLALGEDHMAAWELDGFQGLGERLRRSGLDTLENARTGQGLVHLVPPVEKRTLRRSRRLNCVSV